MQGIPLFFILILVTTTLVSGTPLWERQRQSNVQSSIKANPVDYRLPTDLEPIEYDVRLIPFLETPAVRNFTFEGYIVVNYFSFFIETYNHISIAFIVNYARCTVRTAHTFASIVTRVGPWLYAL
jgi:hypothetical protein